MTKLDQKEQKKSKKENNKVKDTELKTENKTLRCVDFGVVVVELIVIAEE